MKETGLKAWLELPTGNISWDEILFHPLTGPVIALLLSLMTVLGGFGPPSTDYQVIAWIVIEITITLPLGRAMNNWSKTTNSKIPSGN